MGRDKRKGKEPMVEPLKKKKKTCSQKEVEVLPWPPGPLMIRPLVVGVGYRFMSLEPGPRSSRVSELVHLPVGFPSHVITFRFLHMVIKMNTRSNHLEHIT
jgi:hypothetical protein